MGEFELNNGGCGEHAGSSKRRLAVFDIDGTILKGQSPAIMVFNMFRLRVMPVKDAVMAGLWGLRYKAGLTDETVAVRNRIFEAISHIPAGEVDSIISDIYERSMRPRLREKALEKIAWHHEQGDYVVLVSATFEKLCALIAHDVGADAFLATRMHIEDGYYTGDVHGEPVESEEKLLRLVAFADEEFGPDGWEVSYSYADHPSDLSVLSIAYNPVAVNPKPRLEKMAKANGWAIEEW